MNKKKIGMTLMIFSFLPILYILVWAIISRRTPFDMVYISIFPLLIFLILFPRNYSIYKDGLRTDINEEKLELKKTLIVSTMSILIIGLFGFLLFYILPKLIFNRGGDLLAGLFYLSMASIFSVAIIILVNFASSYILRKVIKKEKSVEAILNQNIILILVFLIGISSFVFVKIQDIHTQNQLSEIEEIKGKALMSKDVDLCKEILELSNPRFSKGQLERSYFWCIMPIAQKTGNIQYCDILNANQDPLHRKDQCVVGVARYLNNVTLCKEHSNEGSCLSILKDVGVT